MRSLYLSVVVFLITAAIIFPTDSFSQISGEKEVCSGNSVTFSTKSGDSKSTYTWSFGEGVKVKEDNGSSQTVVFNRTGKYTVTVAISDGSKNGGSERDGSSGSKSESFSVTVNDCCPFEAIINAPDTICQGDYAPVYATDQGDNITYSWNWGGGNSGSTAGKGTHYVWFPNQGSYTITLTVNETCACNNCDDEVATHTIFVKQKPSLSLTASNSGCNYINTNYQFTATSNPGATLSWSAGNGTITGSGSTVNIKWSTPGLKYVNVISNLNGCTENHSLAVSVIDNTCPSATINMADTACQRQSVSYNAGPYAYGVNYSWSFGTGSTPGSASNRTGSVKYSTDGDKTVSLTVSKCGCPNSTTTQNVHVKETPSAAISGVDCGVTGTNYTFSAPSSVGSDYTWNTDGGSGTSTTNEITVSWSSVGSKTLCLTAAKDGCAEQKCKTIDLVSSECPVPDFTIPDTVCKNTNTLLSADNEGFGTTYSWTFENASPSNGNGRNQYVAFNEVGNADVTLTVSKCSCPDSSITKSVYVKPAATAQITGNNFGYVNQAQTFTTPHVPGATYVWSVSGGSGSSTTNSIDITWSTIGWKEVCVYVLNNGCTAFDCFTIGIIEEDCPEAVITGPTQSCVGQTVNFEAQDEGCGVDYYWNINGTNTTGLTTSATFHTPGTYNVQLIISPCGCNSCGNDTASTTITVQPTPEADIVGSTMGETGVTYTFTTPVGNNYSYDWDNGGGSGSSTTNVIDIIWNTPGTKTVCVEVSNGACTASDCHDIEIEDATIDTCDYPAKLNFDQLGLNQWIPGETLIDNGNTNVEIDTLPTSGAYVEVVTSTNFVRNGVFNDTTAYWSQKVNNQGALCFNFNQSVENLGYTIYDLDHIEFGSINVDECVQVEFFNNLTPLTLNPNEYTFGNYVSLVSSGSTLTFCNDTLSVANTESLGDITFDLDQLADSMKITFQPIQNGSGNFTSDIGVSDMTHCSSVPVPVDWLFVDVIAHPEGGQLVWATAQEVNNSHFEIERSADNKHFYPVGKVVGNGTVSEISNYSWIDRSVENAVTYYRIKQVDFDGAFSYSPVVVLTQGLDQSLIFPNPADNRLYISLSDPRIHDVVLYDVFGKAVAHSKDPESSQVIEFDTENLRSGIYFVNYVKEGVVHSIRVMIAH